MKKTPPNKAWVYPESHPCGFRFGKFARRFRAGFCSRPGKSARGLAGR
ncbi:MAG: hypothetical protein ACOYYU_01335 [Chloroflexota bacterium]